MSGTPGTQTVPPPPPAVWLPPMRAGETDGRYVNCSPDLAPFGDTIPNIGVVALAIARQDGQATGSGDLKPAGSAWPDTLNSTKLIPTFGLIAPPASAGVTYVLTVTVNTTTQGRLFIRDLFIQVAARMG